MEGRSAPVTDSYIAMTKWESHFREVFNDLNNQESDSNAVLDLNWAPRNPVTVDGAKALILGLRNGKAPGENGLPPELFTSFPD